MRGIRNLEPQSSRRPPFTSSPWKPAEGHTIDYQQTSDAPTDAERTAIERVLGSDVRTEADDHVVYGGFPATSARRHLLLPALEAVQSDIGWISHGALNHIAARIPVSPAEAFGVASFYELLATEPRPRVVAHVCDDIACMANGVEGELVELEASFGPVHQPVGDAMWVRSPCLGQCDKRSAAFVQVAGGDDIAVAPAPAATVIEILRAGHGSGSAAGHLESPVPAPSSSGGTLLGEAPADLDAYVAGGGYGALRSAFAMGGSAVIDQVETSGLRGRGGAAFPAGVKWRAVAEADGPAFVVCNADESEPGTFKDRVLLEANPYRIIEALTIAGFAVGAARGYVYVRGEYPRAHRRLATAIAEARVAGFLGGDLAGSEFSFDIELRKGAGAYICGEETSLFNSIEGFRGEPRQKPPFPTEAGLFGRPTLVNNVESLANIPAIVTAGGPAFAAIGTEVSTGPKLFCVSGNVAAPGVLEVPFGATARDLISLAGGARGEIAAVLTGGAAGTFIAGEQLDVPLTFEDSRDAGVSLGSGVVMVFGQDVDLAAVVERISRFFEEESCGLCIPCRVGTVRQTESLVRMRTGASRNAELVILDDLDTVMRDASVCGLGQLATTAVQSAITLGLIGSAT